ncbi:MAG: type IV secretory system conjugative DNA transfer family protein [Candidatus Obscuribacterales bacterium]|nr:type IV secretory system conjugative DNA transfer family protein [Candidatus Obscuribacterales bacterium]
MPTVLDLPEPLIIHLPVDAATVVINTALRHTNWRGISGDVHTGSMIATLDEPKSWFQDKPWQLSFQVLFRWSPAPGDTGKTHVRMRLTENNYSNLLQLVQEKQKQLLEALREEEQEAITRGPVQPDPEIHPVASFVSDAELRAAGFLASPDPDRFVIGALDLADIDFNRPSSSFVLLPKDKTERHVLVCGPTGSGKSSAVFIPNLLLRTRTSAIVTETSAGDDPPDLWFKTAGFRAAAGQKIYYFNPDDLTSWRVNPLDRVTTDSDARSVAELLMRTTTQSKHKSDQFWDTSERMLLTALILHAVGERDQGNCNLGFVYDLLIKTDSELKAAFNTSRVPDATRRFKAFISRGTEPTRNIVIASLGQRLALWSNPKIRAMTESTDIDMKALPQELFTFYISFPSAKGELKPLAILVWNYILDFVTTNKFNHPLMLLLDEFAGFGYLAGMRERLAIIRHKHIGAAFGIQDEQQLKLAYDQEAPLFFSQPATKVFFKPQELSLAIRLRDWLGRTTIPKQTTKGGQVSTSFHERFLQSADELMSMDETKMLVFLPGTKPAKLPFISWKQYAAYTKKFSPPSRPAIEVDESIVITERQKPEVKPEKREASPPVVRRETISAQKDDQALDAQKAAEERTREQMLADQKQEIEWKHLEEKRRLEELQRLEEAAGPMILDDDDF